MFRHPILVEQFCCCSLNYAFTGMYKFEGGGHQALIKLLEYQEVMKDMKPVENGFSFTDLQETTLPSQQLQTCVGTEYN